VRWSGTDPKLIELARTNAAAIAAGHSFIVFLAEGFGLAAGAHLSRGSVPQMRIEMSQFWQNLHPRLQPAVPNESTGVPGRK
jgi:hypothetical protein